jgi:hypothetical protein
MDAPSTGWLMVRAGGILAAAAKTQRVPTENQTSASKGLRMYWGHLKRRNEEQVLIRLLTTQAIYCANVMAIQANDRNAEADHPSVNSLVDSRNFNTKKLSKQSFPPQSLGARHNSSLPFVRQNACQRASSRRASEP